MNKDKIIIGTWGMSGDFGKKVDIKVIIKKAFEDGFNQYDTAMVYGDGKVEAELGNFKDGVLKIATKLPAITKPDLMTSKLDIREYYPSKYIKEKIYNCLKRYTSQNIHTFQLHNWHQSFDINYICKELEPYKKDGHFQKIGVSLPEYFPGKVPKYFDSIQIPYNIISLPMPSYISNFSGEIWVRSIFYHGMILKERNYNFNAQDQRSHKVDNVFWEKLEEFKKKKGIKTKDLLIQTVMEDVVRKNIDKVIIGITDPIHLKI